MPAETALYCVWAGEVNWPAGLLDAGGSRCTDARQFANEDSVESRRQCATLIVLLLRPGTGCGKTHYAPLASRHVAFDF